MLLRQTKTAIVSFFIFCSLLSCQQQESNVRIFQEIEEGFKQSNTRIHVQTLNTIESLKQKLAAPSSSVKAEIIYPKVRAIQIASENILVYLHNLKSLLQKQSSTKLVFIEQNKAAELYKRFLQYRDSLVAVDKRIESQIISHLIFISKTIDTSKRWEENVKAIFYNATVHETINFLSRLENNVFIIENTLVNFCNEQVAWHTSIYDSFEALIGQNARILKVGDELEITTGLGAFSRSKLPIVTINGLIQPVNERGIAVYKVKTPKKLGNYTVPVHIKFTDQDGKQQARIFNVEYKVVEAKKKSSASNN